jgi:hypothetical protein
LSKITIKTTTNQFILSIIHRKSTSNQKFRQNTKNRFGQKKKNGIVQRKPQMLIFQLQVRR